MTASRSRAILTLARALLGRAPGFCMCLSETLDAVVSGGSVRHLNKAEKLSAIGLPVNELTMVVDGMLEASFAAQGGQRQLVGFLQPGEFEGVVGLLDGKGHVHDLEARKSSIVLSIPIETVILLRERCPDLVKAMETQLALRMRLTYEALAVHGSKSLEAKLLRLLHLISCAYGLKRNGEILLDMDLSQADLGSWIGGTRQAVNAVIQRLRGSGLIRASYSRITIVDLPGLLERFKE